MRACNPNFLRALWPAFLVALPATALLFSAVDPREVMLFGAPAQISGLGMYTVTFLVLWLLCWVASALNLWLFGCRRDPQWDD
ncbi:MAG: hypothetical protein HIU89_07510 [Proteobacteria bacterium]|uniref:hypothetical protein n=1 Tax=Thiomonas sp. FB-Cd TaxID=1158292 RepID=UPI00068E0E26|nr:hypothetical protein [Thiomonas sp. FB-Cd]MBW4047770.1 hypothetical protein [Pseudomonadota bacterium]